MVCFLKPSKENILTLKNINKKIGRCGIIAKDTTLHHRNKTTYKLTYFLKNQDTNRKLLL